MSDGPLAALLTDPSVEEVHVHGGRVVVTSVGCVSAMCASEEELQALVERLTAIGGGVDDE